MPDECAQPWCEFPDPLLNLYFQAIDGVVTCGEPTLRHAAWFVVPSVCIFEGELATVDQWFEDSGLIERIGPHDGPSTILGKFDAAQVWAGVSGPKL